jgi:diaminopropionate ammonia-lyase
VSQRATSAAELPPVTDWYVNSGRRATRAPASILDDPQAIHRTLPGYEPTPLVSSPTIAAAVGLNRVWVKDESSRLGLPSFKVLGASYALYRSLQERLAQDQAWTSFEDWRRAADALRPLTLVTATEGNHGRAVAHLAKRLGLEARVLVPERMAVARKEAIEREGAVVESIAGTYDDAVAALAGFGGDDYLVLSDTSWDGYEKIPEWVITGYATIFAEVDTQLRHQYASRPDLLIVQAGVGAFAAAASQAWPSADGDAPPLVFAVEPEDAACVLSALRAGKPRQIEGPFDSIMAGLNCGLASAVALRHLQRGLDGIVAVADAHVRAALRLMHASGIAAGPTGAAGVAALLALRATAEETRATLGVGAISDALVICTEGVTDRDEIAGILGS